MIYVVRFCHHLACGLLESCSYPHQTESEGEINQRLIEQINIILLGDYKPGHGLCKGTRRITTIELIV